MALIWQPAAKHSSLGQDLMFNLPRYRMSAKGRFRSGSYPFFGASALRKDWRVTLAASAFRLARSAAL